MTSGKNCGMKAFPAIVPPDGTKNFNPGMTLRDYFAAAALQGLLGSPKSHGSMHEYISLAWKYADAMIAERERP